jgi:2-C-methyl-D-erythritol 4-phosphate cytidylyltransferase
MNTWSVIVAGGSGARFGAMKQLEILGHQRILDWAVQAMDVCEGTVVVVPEHQVAEISASLSASISVVAGGASRAESVRAGLRTVPAEATHVLVHDAARPLASPELVQRVMTALSGGSDGAVPVVPVTDTLRTVDGQPVDRAGYVAVQTPQGFDINVLRAAHSEGAEATDDATLVSLSGGNVVHVEGDVRNIKITVAQDIPIAEALL